MHMIIDKDRTARSLQIIHPVSNGYKLKNIYSKLLDFN